MKQQLFKRFLRVWLSGALGAVFLLTACSFQEMQITVPTSAPLPSAMPTASTESVVSPKIGGSPQPADTAPSVALEPPTGQCADTGCGTLGITQAGSLLRLDLSAQGLSAAPAPTSAGKPDTGRWVIDTGSASPDGRWAAFTSIAYETGGPVFLQNLETGAWTNLIAALNQNQPANQPLPEDLWWDVIGWFPDGQQIVISPSELSSVWIVDLNALTSRAVVFPGGGNGGKTFVDLSADGTQLLYVASDGEANQVLTAYDLASGLTIDLQQVPYEQGTLTNPRFSPGKDMVAYTLQSGKPDTGMSFGLNLLSVQQKTSRVLVPGNLGPTAAVWSPDGTQIAFTRQASAYLTRFSPVGAPAPEDTNIWTVRVADGRQSQMTYSEGQARSPAWAADSKTLAFVMPDGQVGLVSTDQPGQVWQASIPAGAEPRLTNVFFIP